MTEGNNPGAIFKEYVKSLIVEITSENSTISIDPTSDIGNELSDLNQRLEEIEGLRNHIDDLSAVIEDIDFDSIREIGNRLEDMEGALSDINSATMNF